MGAGSAGFGFLIRLYGHPFLAWSQSAENVVPDEPSLRCLPKILMTEQRMAFDMAIYSIDLVEIAMARLRYAAGQMMSKYPEEIQGDLRVRRGMYMDAWSLVNSVHDLRTVLMKFPGKFELPEIEAFIRETEVRRVPEWDRPPAGKHRKPGQEEIAIRSVRWPIVYMGL